MEERERGYGSGPIIFSFFIGGLVGAGIALLLAPKAGRETREKIKSWQEMSRRRQKTMRSN